MSSITVLGAGAWGTAVAKVLAHKGNEVALWAHPPRGVSLRPYVSGSGSDMVRTKVAFSTRAITCQHVPSSM